MNILNQISNKLFYLDYEDRQRVMGDVSQVLSKYEFKEIDYGLSTKVDNSMYYINEYINSAKAEGMSDDTLYNKKNQLIQFMLYTNRSVFDTTHLDIISFIAFKVNNDTKKSTIQNYYKAINTFYVWMVDNEIVEKNPMSKVKRIKNTKTDVDEKIPFTKVEIEKMKDHADKRMLALIEFWQSTGCRINETVNVKLSDIDLDKGEVVIRVAKNDKPRVCYLTDMCVMRIKDYVKSRGFKSKWLFCSKRRPHSKMSTSGLRDSVVKYCQNIGIENVYPHRFRHTFCNTGLEAGMPIQEMQKLMGHASISTTTNYEHTTNKKLRNSFDNYIN